MTIWIVIDTGRSIISALQKCKR